MIKKYLPVMVLVIGVSTGCEKPATEASPERDFESVQVFETDASFSDSSFLSTQSSVGFFPLIKDGVPSNIFIDDKDLPGVKKIAGLFQKDLSHVSGNEPELLNEIKASQRPIIIGTLGQSEILDLLIDQGKIDLSDLNDKWEQFLILPVDEPMEGVDQALIIAGSDKRGTIFGMFELSKQMGVSPWYWWADAPIQSRKNVYVKSGRHTMGEPQVKYRGIFINDEDPALGDWAREKFGGLNHQFYEKVFELILRMKGNYLWPAMWGKSLWDDDSLSAPLANEMGIVLATSHHEPLMRAHVEWGRYGKGAWNYESNPEELRQFWREGMERTQGQEKVVTLAMRGDGDEAMSEDTNIGLLEKIVEDQRKIIEEVTGKPANETPQVWALYKEVQEYYDKGMTVPDDVTLLLCDDNWGQVRILPQLDAKPRSGGYGMYYHFDFVGGPRSYKWLNTVQIERVWEQMRLTYEYGVKEIWLVNVGDLKPMDLPINFFLDYAWNPESMDAKDIPDYYTQWAMGQFGGQYAEEIGDVLALYTKYNARRKPELLAHDTYSVENFNEADRVQNEYNALLEKAYEIKDKLPKEAQDAYYQLVLYPVEACANMNEMYVAAAKNKLYRTQNRASTNYYADRVKELFFKDGELLDQHNEFAGGKWNHIMKQTHMGHVSWFDPKVNKMPEVSYIQVPSNASLGYALESGEMSSWRNRAGLLSKSFTPFDPLNNQKYFIDVFNLGSEKLSYKVEAKNDWIVLSSNEGNVELEEKVYVSIDWSKVADANEGEIVLSQVNGRSHTIKVPVRTNVEDQVSVFVENNGIVSMNAENYQRKEEVAGISWELIPNLGRTHSAITTAPVTAKKQSVEKGPYVEYDFYLLDSGTFKIDTWFSPTLNYQKDEGLLYAVSIDGGKAQLLNLHEEAKAPDWTYPSWWNNAVTDNLMKQQAMELSLPAGKHTLRYQMVDPGLVLQKITLTKNGVNADSYLGAPESVVK